MMTCPTESCQELATSLSAWHMKTMCAKSYDRLYRTTTSMRKLSKFISSKNREITLRESRTGLTEAEDRIRDMKVQITDKSMRPLLVNKLRRKIEETKKTMLLK